MIAIRYAAYEQDETRILDALKKATSSGDESSSAKCKELSKELVRVRLKTKALSTELDKRRMGLKDYEKRLAVAIRDANHRQGRTDGAVDADIFGSELLIARANVRDFDEAFARLRTELNFVEKIDFPIETFKRAMEFDGEGDYEKALILYREGLDQIVELDNIINDESKRRSEGVVKLLENYVKRVDELKNCIYMDNNEQKPTE